MPAILALALAVAGCGSSSPATGRGSGSTARQLLSETFGGRHTIDSGVLTASITLAPEGSSEFTKPLSLDFSGPFQSRGPGRLPQSDFTIAIHFEGQTGQIQVLSTGTAGYVILDDTAYKLPAASFKKLESGLSNVGSSGGSGGSSGSSSSSASGAFSLSGLGIHPEKWLADPEVEGTARIAGVETDHIHGTVALAPLLQDLSKILSKVSTVTSAAGDKFTSLTPAEQAKIRGEVKRTSFDLWTGITDHTIRKLDVSAILPVSGKVSRQLGGLSAARVAFAFGYSDIGQTETITAPASSEPYAQFETKITELVEEIEELAESDAGTAGAAGSSSSSG